MEIIKWRENSVEELVLKLNKLNTNKLLLGKDGRAQEGLHIFQLSLNGIVKFAVGVITEGYWLEPQCKYVCGRLLVGFNEEIHIIDINNNENKIISTCSYFFQFEEMGDSDRIIGIFEIEIICFSLDGIIDWRYNTDLITEYSVKNSIIDITTFEGEKEMICLLTGKKV